jgi:crossover junction endodeoxyribonuclease RusA
MRIIFAIKPCSINHYWRHRSCKTFISTYISAEGKQFASYCSYRFKQDHPNHTLFEGPLTLNIFFLFKDKRSRDTGNYEKALLDALTGVLYVDDRQVIKETLEKRIGAGVDGIIIEVSPYCEEIHTKDLVSLI